MHRAILIQCLPALIALAISFAAVVLLVKFSGAKLNLRRLRALHRCQDGGVQSLSFVLTLPLFLIFVMFIVQISQLMIGMVTVNYAAFAAARSASVWIPAEVQDMATGRQYRLENRFQNLTRDGALELAHRQFSQSPGYGAKHFQVFSAATLACSSISPSRNVGEQLNENRVAEMIVATQQVYSAMDPAASSNPRIPRRINNKLTYAHRHTTIRIEFRDKNSDAGPTYNPRQTPICEEGQLIGYVSGHPNEVGWEDPITVTVYHDFALFPGPGRFLAKYIVGQREDRVARRIRRQSNSSDNVFYTTQISASATLTNEGFKSALPYEQQRY